MSRHNHIYYSMADLSIGYYCPSYKRADDLKIRKWFPGVWLCIHEFEWDYYADVADDPYGHIMPDDLKGNMAKVRNWILDNAEEDVVIMIDDDVKGLYRVEDRKWEQLSLEEVKEKCQQWAQEAYHLGTPLFGVNTNNDRGSYREYSPISFLSPILGSFFGIIKEGNDIRFDERLSLNEDFDYYLQVIRKHHKALRWNKYHYKAAHIKGLGGCCSYRTTEEEKRQAEIMLRKWGSDVVRYNFARSTNPIIKTPIRGI